MLNIQPINFSTQNKKNNQKVTFSALPRKNGMHGDIHHNEDMYYAFNLLIKEPIARISNKGEDIFISKRSYTIDKIKKIADIFKTKLDKKVSALSKYKTEDKLGQCIYEAYDISLMSPKAVKIAPVINIEQPHNYDYNEEKNANKIKKLKVPFTIDADGKDYIVPMDLLSKEMRKIIDYGMDEYNTLYVTHNYELGEDMYTVRVLNLKDNTSGLRITKGIGDWSTRAEALKEVL